jgi:hypothetical protein
LSVPVAVKVETPRICDLIEAGAALLSQNMELAAPILKEGLADLREGLTNVRTDVQLGVQLAGGAACLAGAGATYYFYKLSEESRARTRKTEAETKEIEARTEDQRLQQEVDRIKGLQQDLATISDTQGLSLQQEELVTAMNHRLTQLLLPRGPQHQVEATNHARPVLVAAQEDQRLEAWFVGPTTLVVICSVATGAALALGLNRTMSR